MSGHCRAFALCCRFQHEGTFVGSVLPLPKKMTVTSKEPDAGAAGEGCVDSGSHVWQRRKTKLQAAPKMRRNWMLIRIAHVFIVLQKCDVFPSEPFCGEICDDQNLCEHWGGWNVPLKVKDGSKRVKGCWNIGGRYNNWEWAWTIGTLVQQRGLWEGVEEGRCYGLCLASEEEHQELQEEAWVALRAEQSWTQRLIQLCTLQ